LLKEIINCFQFYSHSIRLFINTISSSFSKSSNKDTGSNYLDNISIIVQLDIRIERLVEEGHRQRHFLNSDFRSLLISLFCEGYLHSVHIDYHFYLLSLYSAFVCILNIFHLNLLAPNYTFSISPLPWGIICYFL